MTEEVSRNLKSDLLGALSRKEYGERELIRKMVKWGHEETAVREELVRLQDYGLQDDRRLLRLIVREAIRRDKGAAWVYEKAKHKRIGAPRELVAEFFTEESPLMEVERVKKHLEGSRKLGRLIEEALEAGELSQENARERLQERRKARDRLSRRLLAAGFSSGAVQQGLEQFLKELK